MFSTYILFHFFPLLLSNSRKIFWSLYRLYGLVPTHDLTMNTPPVFGFHSKLYHLTLLLQREQKPLNQVSVLLCIQWITIYLFREAVEKKKKRARLKSWRDQDVNLKPGEQWKGQPSKQVRLVRTGPDSNIRHIFNVFFRKKKALISNGLRKLHC